MVLKKKNVNIIAEIGTSHGGDISKAKQLIKAASQAGANAVKFQWVYADEILHPNTGTVKLPGGKIRLYDRFKQLEVPSDFFVKAKDFAHSCGCDFICTPFGTKSLEELEAIEPDAIKIASPELNHFPLLKHLAQIQEKRQKNGAELFPVILSSGVSTLADIEKAIQWLGPSKKNMTLLHCLTAYPAPPQEYNVSVIENLCKIFGVQTGVSDHTMHPYLVPVLATCFGAVQIEKHITLSRKTDGLDDPVALEPQDFALMVQKVRQAEDKLKHEEKNFCVSSIIQDLESEIDIKTIKKTIGDGVKKIAASELDNYGRTNRSIHFMDDMKAGEVVAENSIAVLRTEKNLTPGIEPEHIDKVYGAILSQDVSAGQGLEWNHILHRSLHT